MCRDSSYKCQNDEIKYLGECLENQVCKWKPIKGTQKPYDGLQYVTIDQSSKPTRKFSQYRATHVPKCKPPFLNEETYYVAILPLLTDVPKTMGVCTDVVIRAYRKLGIDLQELIIKDKLRK